MSQKRLSSSARLSARALIILGATSFTAALTLTPLVSTAAPPGTFSGSSSSAGMEIAILASNPANPQAVMTLAVTSSEHNSNPLAKARGSGVCEVLAPGENLSNVPCTASNTQTAEATTGTNDPPKKCDASLPAPVGNVFTLQSACGDALAKVTGRDPLADALGEVSRVEMKLDLGPLNPALESAKDQFVTAIGPVLAPAPDNLENAILSALRGDVTGMAARIGNTTANSSSVGNLVKTRADAGGTTIGIIGIPICNPGCTVNPDPVTDGLILIETSDSFAETAWDGSAASANANTTAVTVKVRDLMKPAERAYTNIITVTPTQSQAVLAGGTVETTITFTPPTTSVNNQPGKGSASASIDGVVIQALKGLGAVPAGAQNGGIRIKIAPALAQVQGDVAGKPPPLAGTGGMSLIVMGLGMLAAGLWLVRKLRVTTV